MLTLSEVKNDMLTVKDDVLALKRRQELVFKNQDIINSTLAGEIRREHPSYSCTSHSFRSPSAAPSVVAWSPPFPSTQIRQSPAALTPETQLSSYSTQVNSIDVDSFSNEDVQSFFNVDWGGGQKSETNTSR